MLNVLVNGMKSKVGGGKSYLNNYLALLKSSNPTHRYFILTPDKTLYEQYSAANIEIIDIPSIFKNNFLFLILYHVIMPRLLHKYDIDLIFNLGDLVIPTRVPQVYLFDWAYAVYPRSIAWKRLDMGGLLSCKIKLFWFKRYLKYAAVIIAQTTTIRNRFKAIYGLDNIQIIPNAVSIDNITGGIARDFRLPGDRFKLLYLTHYYAHKNLEIFIPLARKIKDLSLPYCLITTIAPAQHRGAAAFLDRVKKEALEGVIVNVGPVEMANVPSLYAQCDALLMPTLLESFAGTYVEAMFHSKPILTSRLDFAEDICGDSAFYFDPLDGDSILDCINLAYENSHLRREYAEKGRRRARNMLTWAQAFIQYQEFLEGASPGSQEHRISCKEMVR